jgi:multicomponent Na+:H+ antiporter subunit A
MTGAPHTEHLWHGITVKAAAVTAAALAGGAALFAVRALIIKTVGEAGWLSAGRAYEWLYAGTLQTAKAFTGLYMTGRLRDYLVLIMIAALAGLAYGLARTGLPVGLSLAGLDPGEAISILVAIAASVAAVRLKLLLGAVLALGVAGYSVSLVYLLLSAPDIAMTQVAIETVSIVLFLVALTALGQTHGDARSRQPLSDGLIAAATGGVSVALALMVADIASVPRIAASFFANAAQAGGTNVVNLVIIDFRGWDTMGEISVLGIAALGIMAMAPWRPRGVPDGRTNAREYPAMTSLILRTVTAFVAPIIIVFALRLWWTGHYGPGGGFVGGLMVAAALSLLALEGGAAVLVRRWDWLMALGLALAVGSAIVPMLFGYSPLQHTVVYWPIKLASSLIFDLGVLLLVTGTVMAAIRSLVEAA